jgi:hypothetical protein
VKQNGHVDLAFLTKGCKGIVQPGSVLIMSHERIPGGRLAYTGGIWALWHSMSWGLGISFKVTAQEQLLTRMNCIMPGRRTFKLGFEQNKGRCLKGHQILFGTLGQGNSSLGIWLAELLWPQVRVEAELHPALRGP